MVNVYASGVVMGEPGHGAWAALVVDEEGRVSRYSGMVSTTTPERIEIKSVIEGILRTPPGSRVTAFSNSTYVMEKVVTNERPREHRDLWAVLDRLVVGRAVVWHTGEEAASDVLQVEAIRFARETASLSDPNVEFPAVVVVGQDKGGEILHAEVGIDDETGQGSIDVGIDKRLTHVDSKGEARMVDISAKEETERVAVAKGRVVMEAATLELIRSGQTAKGDVLSVARIAGIMGAKQTASLIPLCHPLMLTDVIVEFELNVEEKAVEITGIAKTRGRTGVEMEALTAVSTAALTIYDMCKAADRNMRIDRVRLVRKTGGKSGEIVLE